MSNGQKSLSINETFIIEPENDGTISACTGFYTNSLISCDGNTQIILGTDIIETNAEFIATKYYGDGSSLTGILSQDTFVTGGTYSSGTSVFRNNTGGTFSVTGFSTGYTLTTNEITNTLGYTPLSAYTDTFVTGGTVSGNTAIFTNNTGNTFSVTGFSTGYTLTLSDITNTLGYTPLSAYTDSFVTGGTVSGSTTIFTNNTGGTFSVTGFSTGYTLTTNEITNTLGYTPLSAYTDTFVTGGTYSSSAETATFANNTGGTFTIAGIPNGNTKKWKNGGSVQISGGETILVSGNYVLQDSELNILDDGDSISIGNITFEKKGELYIGENVFFKDTTINNDGIISIGGALILSGNTIIIGTGIII
jgi:hypothetical protein